MTHRRASRRSASPRAFPRRLSAWWPLLVVVALLALFIERDTLRVSPPTDRTLSTAPEIRSVDFSDARRTYFVERVVDGDTLLLAGGERLRLIGVDTPETVAEGRPVEPFGPEATAFTKRAVERKWITLAFDKERRDRYGRLLVYVTVDGRLLNEELIRAGLSPVQRQYPYSNLMKRRFQNAEDEARSAGRGLWSADLADSRRGAKPSARPRR